MDLDTELANRIDLVQLGVDVIERFGDLSEKQQAEWIENYAPVNVRIFKPVNLVQALHKQEGNDVLKVYNILKKAEDNGTIDLSKKWIVYVELGEVICVDSLVEAGCR